MASSERTATDEFDDRLRALVERAADDGASAHAVEAALQRAAQRVRERRRVNEVHLYECPEPGCESSHVEPVDRSATVCDVCHAPGVLAGFDDGDGERLLRFECPNGDHSVRRHALALDAIRCRDHDRLMERMGSYDEAVDLGDDR